MTHIGFTGTRRGMTAEQRRVVFWTMPRQDGATFHHGDCVGADAEAHAIADHLGYTIEVHPPIWGEMRAGCKGHINHTPKRYLDRNRDIVAACNLLIAAPHGPEEVRSGTWSTVRYARKCGKRVLVVMPDGEVVDA